MSVKWEQVGGAVVERDRWGRPLIEGKAWTRATTFAGSIADKEGLIPWACEMTARGLATRPELVAAAASVLDDPKALRKVAQDAKEAGGAMASATLGTALHRMTEQADRGEPFAELHADRIAQYRACLDAHGIEILPDWIERMVLVDAFDVAGTPDRIVKWRGRPTVLDLKTGKDLRYAMSEIAIQLALYANATAGWDPDAGQRVDMPDDLRNDVALIVWLPAAGDGCQLIEVDTAAGWEAASLAGAVRAWRKRRDLHQVAEVEAVEVEAVAKPARIIGSVTPITKAEAPTWERPDEGAELDVATLKEEISGAIATWAARVDVEAADIVARLSHWKDQGKAGGRPFHIHADTGRATTRRRGIYGAAVRLAALTTDDDDARDVIATATGLEVQPGHPVGVALGALTSHEAALIRGHLDAVHVVVAAQTA